MMSLKLQKRIFLIGICLLCIPLLMVVTRVVIMEGQVKMIKHRINPGFMNTTAKDITRTPGPIQVLLVAYMRSGSTLTGSILERAKEAFYVFEPLRVYSNIMKAKSNTSRDVRNEQTIKDSINIIRSWLTCDMEKIPDEYLKDGFLDFGRKTAQYRKCLKGSSTKKNKTTLRAECKPVLKQLCNESPVRILKTIRLSMEEVQPLIVELPNLYTVHLVRDPRDTLNSQRKFGMCSPAHGGQEGCVNSLCTRMENDLIAETRLSRGYPGRFMTLHHRMLSLEPLTTSRNLYDFLGLKFTKEVEEFVRNRTMTSETKRSGPFSTTRNSSLLVDSWKSSIPTELLRMIEKRCNYLLKYYG